VHLHGERLRDVAFGHHREMFWAASTVQRQLAVGTDSRAPSANYPAAAAVVARAMTAVGRSRLRRRSRRRAEIRRVLPRLP